MSRNCPLKRDAINNRSHPRDSNSVPIPYEGIALPGELGWPKQKLFIIIITMSRQ